MTTDALDVRRSLLVGQAEDVAVQLADPRAWPWLVQAGADPELLLKRLREVSVGTRRSLVLANAARKEVRGVQRDVAPVLQRVRGWQVEVRGRLKQASADELARLAVAELRGLVRTGAVRLTGALVMLHTAVGRLRDHAGVLGMDVGALATMGDALRGELLALQRGQDRSIAARVLADQTAREEVEALRRLMREVRASWKLARALAGGTLPPLGLALAKGGVLARPRAQPRKGEAGGRASPGGGPMGGAPAEREAGSGGPSGDAAGDGTRGC